MSNEKFKVQFGLQVGEAGATIDGTTGDIDSFGDINGNSFTTNSLSTQYADLTSRNDTSIFTLAETTQPSMRALVYIKDSITGNVQFAELLLVSTGSTTAVSNISTIGSTLTTFSVDTNSGNLRLRATTSSSNNTGYKVLYNVLG